MKHSCKRAQTAATLPRSSATALPRAKPTAIAGPMAGSEVRIAVPTMSGKPGGRIRA